MPAEYLGLEVYSVENNKGQTTFTLQRASMSPTSAIAMGTRSAAAWWHLFHKPCLLDVCVCVSKQ